MCSKNQTVVPEKIAVPSAVMDQVLELLGVEPGRTISVTIEPMGMRSVDGEEYYHTVTAEVLYKHTIN